MSCLKCPYMTPLLCGGAALKGPNIFNALWRTANIQFFVFVLIFCNGYLLTFSCLFAELFLAEYNEEWKRNRKLATQALRTFGFGNPEIDPELLAQVRWNSLLLNFM